VILLGTAVLSQVVPAQARQRWSPVDAARAAGQRLFEDHCAACPSRTGVAKGYGPYLLGGVGRRGRAAAGFFDVPGLRNSGIVWSVDNLMKWIANPHAMVPDTPMPHVAISDPAERYFVIEYLKSVRG